MDTLSNKLITICGSSGVLKELDDFFMFIGNCVDVDPKDMEVIESKIESIANMFINVRELLDTKY